CFYFFNKSTACCISSTLRPPPTSTLFPYTTLFRSPLRPTPQPRPARPVRHRRRSRRPGRLRCSCALFSRCSVNFSCAGTVVHGDDDCAPLRPRRQGRCVVCTTSFVRP